MLRQLLHNAPKSLLYVPVGVCLVALGILLGGAGSFRRRCILLGGAALVTAALAGLLALTLSRVVCASLRLEVGVRLEGNRMFAQCSSNERPRSGVISKLLRILDFRSKFMPSLSTEFWPSIPGEWLPESPTRFFNRLTGMPVTFSRDRHGRTTGLIVRLPAADFSFAKISDRPPKAPEAPKQYVPIRLDPKRLDAFIGQYEFAPNAAYPTGARLTIRRKGSQLVGDVRGKNIFGGSFELYPESETNLFDTIYCAQYRFRKNDRGEVTVGIHYWGPDLEGKKLSARTH